MLLSLLLQNCGGPTNLPIEGEEELTTIEREEQGRRKRVRIEMEQGEEPRLMEHGQEVSSFDIFPSEIWQEIFSHLDFEEVLDARVVSGDWNELVTGSRQAGIVGVENKPHHIIDARNWVKRKGINFRDNKLKELTPATIPSFVFYYLMGHVINLPYEFWPYLQGTQVHTFDLCWNQIDDHRAIELAKALPATRVHTLYLGGNGIGDAGAIDLAKALPSTQVHTLYLVNQIGAAGAIELAKALPDTQVHTLHLSWNRIRASGAIELAKVLPRAQVRTLNLSYNEIGAAGAIELAKALPATRVHTLDLGYNQIGDSGAIELAKHLQGIRVHMLQLEGNEIGKTTQQLLVKQYPHINWKFFKILSYNSSHI